MKKVLFAITNLEIGGAEKVLVNLVNQFKEQYEITILTLYGNGCLEKEIDPKVKIQSIHPQSYESLSLWKKKYCALSLKIPFLRRRIYQKYINNKYDVEIAFLEGPITELLQEKSNAHKIAWIHTNLENHYPKKNYDSLIQLYQSYQNLVFVSQNSLDQFLKIDSNHRYQGKMQVIHNYVDFDKIVTLSKEKITDSLSKEWNFVTVARLVPAKGIDRLMKVHQKVLKEGIKHQIYVIGDGPLKEDLLALQKEYKIESTFHFFGQKKNPYPYIKKADCFLLPSYYEGYPVTLMEAMALNQSIVTTDIAGSEVLKDYPNKIIVENSEEGIAQGLKEAMKVPKHKKTGKVLQNEKILNAISQLIEEEKK